MRQNERAGSEIEKVKYFSLAVKLKKCCAQNPKINSSKTNICAGKIAKRNSIQENKSK